ncbi:MAG: hypothetical protein L0G87_02710 [Renibacterium salmoninarum]|nr:hypothetical protein [Renibacterium salmoninarum]
MFGSTKQKLISGWPFQGYKPRFPKSKRTINSDSGDSTKQSSAIKYLSMAGHPRIKWWLFRNSGFREERIEFLLHVLEVRPDKGFSPTEKAKFRRTAQSYFAWRLLNFLKFSSFLVFVISGVVAYQAFENGWKVLKFIAEPILYVSSATFTVTFIFWAALTISTPGQLGLPRFLKLIATGSKRFDSDRKRSVAAANQQTSPVINQIFGSEVSKAARNLMIHLSAVRWSVVNPPALRETAVLRGYATMSALRTTALELNNESGRVARAEYCVLLRDVASLVAIGRPDLIVEYVQFLAPNSVLSFGYLDLQSNPAVPEVDADFLDAFRNKTRAEIVRDYIYPLASWLAVILSTVALVVSFTRG